jgi:predicted esterase
MPSWFDFYEVAFAGREDANGIEKASEYVKSLIDNEIKSSGLTSRQIVLAGYSQGSLLALYTALTFDKPLAGAVAISGFLPLAKRFPAQMNECNKDIPIFQVHGDEDEIVPIDVYLQSKEYTQTQSIGTATFKVYQGMGHDPSDKLLHDVANFIHKL